VWAVNVGCVWGWREKQKVDKKKSKYKLGGRAQHMCVSERCVQKMARHEPKEKEKRKNKKSKSNKWGLRKGLQSGMKRK